MNKFVLTTGVAMLLGSIIAPSLHAQRRGETMKVTAADDRKAQVTPTDEGFVRSASGAYQAGSRLAMLIATGATDERAKAFGSRLVKDYIALGDKLKPAASGEKGYQWAHEVPPADAKTLDALDRLRGAERDKALHEEVVAQLERLQAAFAAESEKGRDPDLKPIAQDTLPVIRQRLAEAKALGHP